MMPFRLVVEPDVVHDQIAAAPETLELLIVALGTPQQASPWGASAFDLSLPLVPDPELPPWEVHMRRVSPIPFTRVEQDEALRSMLEYMRDAGLGGGRPAVKWPMPRPGSSRLGLGQSATIQP